MKLQQKLLIAGGIVGALLGLAAAALYIKANESQFAAVEAGDAEGLGKVSPAAALTVGVSLVSLLRQFTTLGQG